MLLRFSSMGGGVWITTGSTPVLRCNRIHSVKQVSVACVCEGGITEHGCGSVHQYYRNTLANRYVWRPRKGAARLF